MVTDEEHGNRYRELFGPSITKGMLKPSDLAVFGAGAELTQQEIESIVQLHIN